ncbi:MAG: YicC family protein [Firmicutes bacterium]|nr:YicC family protein [Bacillota bacterium]
MPFSMTGYGRFKLEDDSGFNITVEIKSVNHRFLDLSFRLPKNYLWLEESLVKVIKPHFQRGRIDVFVSIEHQFTEQSAQLTVNRGLLTAYLQQFKQLKKEFKLPGKIRMEQLLMLPELFTMKEEINEEALQQAACKALQGAAEALLEMRRKEGEMIAADLSARLDLLTRNIEEIQELASALPSLYQEKLQSAARELLGEIEVDEQKLATEVLFYVERSAITEEIVRFKSHLAQFRSTLQTTGSIGRKLDFITQELHREINTIAAKTTDLSISQYIVNMKTEIEKIREQVQNIE